jgi:hypothetical protein
MNTFSINWLAVALGTLAIFMIQAIWFGPKTFYPVWWKALGKEPTKPEDQDTSGKTMLRLFGGSFAAALAQTSVLYLVIFGSGLNVLGGAVAGFGLGVVAAGASLGHRLFGQQGFKVWIIEVGADVVALTVAGAILAALITA